MYLLSAPHEKFKILPPNTPLITESVKFTQNVAYCNSFYWWRIHIQQGCVDITPKHFKKLRKQRQLKQIIVMADGGVGDIIWNLPFIYNLKKTNPTAVIGVITSVKHSSIFKNIDYVSFIASNNIWNVQGMLNRADEIYDFGGVATVEKKYKDWDPVDATFDWTDTKPPKDKTEMIPKLSLTVDEGKQTTAFLKSKGIDIDKQKLISICTHSSTPNRDYPLEYIKAISMSLQKQGNSVLWLGTNKFHRDSEILKWCKENNIINLVDETSLREAFCMIALSDLFIGPNSGLMVAACSLGTPTIAIFGAFRAKHRCRYYKKFMALEGNRACSPCSEHWTECNQGYPAPCMKQILPKLVVEKSKEMIQKYPKELIEKKPIE